MAWTTPKTWGTGDLVTAADLNTHLRDNLSYLKTAITFDSVTADNNYTSSAHTAFVDVDSGALSLTVTTRGKLALVGFETAAHQSSAAQAMSFDITVDGGRVGTSGRGLVYHHVSSSVNYATPTPVRGQHWLTNLAAGVHTLRLVWRQIDTNSIAGYIDNTASGGMPTRLWLLEFDI